MTSSQASASPAVGFLAVIDDPQLGLLGGYLVLNRLARPVEFHCTSPLKASRAQEILYGPTLKPYLYGEQIGGALLGKAKAKPLFVCTNERSALAVRDFTDTPVALIRGADDGAALDVEPSAGERLLQFELGGQSAAVSSLRTTDRDAVASAWPQLPENFDLAEPFSRIEEAIREAQAGPR